MGNISILLLFLWSIGFGQQTSSVEFNTTVHNPEITYLHGTWRITSLIVDKSTKEYTLSGVDPSQRFSYGNSISFKPDGSFVSRYSARCGNDCFTTSVGKYKMLDEDYIGLYLESIFRSGDCSGGSDPNEYFGLFRIYKEKGKVLLRRSDGNPHNDLKNLQYIDILAEKSKYIAGYFNIKSFLKWATMKWSGEMNEIAAFGMAQNNIADYEVLYEGNFAWTNLILTKVGGKFRYILYEREYANHIRVALFDEDFFKTAEDLVARIDAEDYFNIETFKETYDYSKNPSTKNTVVLYTRLAEIQKIFYNMYDRQGDHFKVTFYLKEGIPHVIRIQTPTDGIFCYYVFNWDKPDGAVMKPTVKNWSFSGVRQRYYQFMEDIRKQQLER
ncbi:MAG TPA: hypothetical protein VF676_02935 [Flavobacterium sp.]|jgi:hypothetical protein